MGAKQVQEGGGAGEVTKNDAVVAVPKTKLLKCWSPVSRERHELNDIVIVQVIQLCIVSQCEVASRSICNIELFNALTKSANTYHTALPVAWLPFPHIPSFGHTRPNNLVTIQQTKRIKSFLELPHRINCRCTQLVRQIISLDESYTMLACRCAFEFNCSFDHFVDEVFGFLEVGLPVVEDDG